MVHFLLAFWIPMYSSFNKLSLFGKPPVVLVSFRNCRCIASIELVVQMIRRMSRGYLEHADKCCHKESEAGIPVPELCRKYGMGSASFYKWRVQVQRHGCVAHEAVEGT